MLSRGSRLFGTDGVRGVTNSALTSEFITRLAGAIGYYFGKSSKLLIGRDARAGSYFIHHIVVGTLLSEGVRVFDAGLVPTPALQYYIKEKGFDGGVMITASHNPPEYSGLKVILGDGIEAPRKVEEEIERYFHEGRSHRPPWIELGYDVKRVDDVLDFYITSVVNMVDKELIRASGFKVVVDGANNVGSLTTPKMLRELGAKVMTLNTEISHIPNRPPEPTPESLVQLSNAVKSSNSHIGVAHDGDADRAIFVDDIGRVIPGDRSAVLLCKHILTNRKDNTPRRIITAVSSSTIVEDVLKGYGVEVIWTKVGSVVIAREMVKLGAMAGFEENGGFMYPPHQYVRDGAMALALMLEFLAKEKVRLSDAVNGLPHRYLIKTKIPLKSREKLSELYDVLKEKFYSDRIISVDGVKVIGKSYWFLVRPSGTEPVLRIFVESSSKVEAEKLLNLLKSILDQVLK